MNNNKTCNFCKSEILVKGLAIGGSVYCMYKCYNNMHTLNEDDEELY